MTPELESDTLSSLEERIHRAVQLVSKLRQEKESALQEAADAQADAAEARTEADRLSGLVKTLEADRKQVRTRIEKLLGQIDQLSGS